MTSYQKLLKQQILQDVREDLRARERAFEHEIQQARKALDENHKRNLEFIRRQSPTNPGSAPANPAPAQEPSLQDRLSAMEPQEFYAAMKKDPKGLLAKLAEVEAAS
ncbi:MAG: hypothetical protein AAFY20_08715 [Cyanobacteria bacterium J06639_14]